MPATSRLNPAPEEIQALGDAAVALMTEYYAGLPGRRIMPQTSARLIRELLDEPLPRAGTDFATIVRTVREVVLPLSRHNGHPRFFGYVASPGTPVAAAADMIAATLNSNVTAWRSAPAGTEIEHIAVNWLKQILGYPADAAGLLVSGGSMANFAALTAAREAAVKDVSEHGIHGPARLRVYISREGHFSIRKAAGMLGIGRANVVAVKTDDRFRIDPADLERSIEADRRAGYVPICVVANAGSVATGAFDSLETVAGVAERHGLWFHVDGAYGGFAALAPSARPLFRGIERADSVALDPHKWLYLPTGCGCVLYRNPETARAAFHHDAEYVKQIGLEPDESFAFWDYGPELSRRFRALSLWMLVKYVGTDELSRAVDGNIEAARYFESLVRASPDFEMLAPVTLSIFCFRYAPKAGVGDLDAWNERILIRLQRGGSSYLSNAVIDGKFALRGCVLNYRTTPRDMEVLLDDVRRTAGETAPA